MKLNELFKNTSYDDTLFSSEAITTIEKGIFTKNIKGKEVPYFKCLVREKDIKLTPEEAIRQLYIWKLVIIDPLNEEWQLIFKNAYLVLKEIVDLNISEIGKTAIAENSVV